MIDQYIGISGYMNRHEVDASLEAFPDCGHKFMDGVLASSKTLRDTPNKYPLRYPKRADIAGIFSDDPRCLNLVHLAFDAEWSTSLLTDMVLAMHTGGPRCHGLQLNGLHFAYMLPHKAEHVLNALDDFQYAFKNLRIVLQAGPGVDEGIEPGELVDRLAPFVPYITDVLLDASGGRGVSINPPFARSFVDIARKAYPGLGIGIAGGLCASTVPLVGSFIRDRISIDAEGKLRDDMPGGGNLDIPKVRAYLEAVGKELRI